MKIAWTFVSTYSTIALISITFSLLAFTGEKESEVAGNLIFSMLVIGFPGSLIAYPAGMFASDLYASYEMYAYDSRLVLSTLWLIYFCFGVIQWLGIAWLLSYFKAKKQHRTDKT